MEIRILKASSPHSWYRDKIGEVFKVLQERNDRVIGKIYITHFGRMVNSFVVESDCQIIDNSPIEEFNPQPQH